MESWQEAILFNTTQIEATSPTECWAGTGFFIQHAGRIFLVSNRHVLDDDHTVTYTITVHRHSPAASDVFLSLNNTRYDIDYCNPFKISFDTRSGYFAHPNAGIDLACIDLTGIANPKDSILVPLSLTKVLNWAQSKLIPSQQVIFVGYPNSIKDQLYNLPVVRTGTIASMPMLDFGGEPTILLDSQIWAGSSGSPVFMSAESDGGTFSLVGVIRSALMKADDGQSLGLGHAVKSSELVEMILNAGGVV